MQQRHHGSWLLASLSAATLLACNDSSPKPPPPTEMDDETSAIIGGLPANSANLNAVGVLGYKYSDSYYGYEYWDPFCSGVLIGEQTVLTAKHCVEAARSADGVYETAMFGVGPNGNAPQRTIEIVDTEVAPGNAGGFVGYGRDVGVVHLVEKVSAKEAKPWKTAPITDAMVDSSFAVIGYGVQDNSYTYGTRRVGTVKLRGLRGKVFEMMFGSFAAFKDWYLGNGYYGSHALPLAVSRPGVTVDAAPPIIDGGPVIIDGGPLPIDGPAGDVYDWMEAYLRELYDTTVLLEGYEAYVGNAPGNAQPCFGDSGGPLARLVNGELTVFGVTSGGIDSSRLVCDYGAVYATFGPDVATFIKTALTWKDPCAGVSRLGVCQKNSSQRCSSTNEGTRRLLVVECALLGQTCVIASDGQALCAYAGEDPLAMGTGGVSGSGGTSGTGGGTGGATGRPDAGRASASELSIDDVKALVEAMVKKAHDGYRPPFARKAQ